MILTQGDPLEIIEWFERQGDPETDISSPHLQQWIGNGWVMKQQFTANRVTRQLIVLIADSQMEEAFKKAFAWAI